MYRRVFWITFIALDAILILLYLTGYLAYYVRFEIFWWVELIAVFIPYLTIAILATTVVAIVGRRWVLLGLHALVVALILVRTNPFDRIGRAVPENPDDLIVLSFNVPRWWGHLMPEKTTEMAELISRLDPDVIGLQEALIAFHPEPPPRRAAPYISVLYDSLGYSTAGPNVDGISHTHQPVLSRLGIEHLERFDLKRNRADSISTNLTRTVLRWKGQSFALYNLHLRTFGEQKLWHEDGSFLLSWRNLIPYLRRFRGAYGARAWEIDRIVEMLSEEELPFVILGDLNSTPHNWVMGRLSGVARDAFRVAGRGWGMTYHTRLPVFRIDYVLVSDHWDVVSAEVADAYLSDHLPVVARLRLKE